MSNLIAVILFAFAAWLAAGALSITIRGPSAAERARDAEVKALAARKRERS